MLHKKLKLPQKNKRFTLFIVAAFAGVGTLLLVLSQAATTTASFSLSPASGSYNVNTNFTVDVYEDSLTQPINAVSAKMSYNASQLQVISVVTTGTAFAGCPTATGSAGTISLVCYVNPPTTITGRQRIATITFKALAGTGTSTVSFVNESPTNSRIALAGSGENIWNGITTGGTFTLTTPDTAGPVVTWNAPAASAVLSGSVPVKVAVTDDRGVVSSVNLKIGNSTTTFPMTLSGSEYVYNWNTASGSFADGTYTLTVTATDPAGNVNPIAATRSVTVQNNKPDLTATSITLVPGSPDTGNLVTISASVKNNGTAAIAAGTSKATAFTVGATTISTVTDTSGLAVGASYTVTSTVNWTAVSGASTLGVTVDKNGQISESNETNNSSTKSISVYNAGDSGVTPGKVDLDDLLAVLNHWNQTGQTRQNGDLSNGDGIVNLDDLLKVLNNWNP